MQEIVIQLPMPVDGLRLDIPPEAVGPTALTDASNFVYRHGKVKPRYGYSTFGAAAVGSKVTGLVGYGSTVGAVNATGGGDQLVVGTQSNWYKYAAGVWTSLGGGLSANDHTVFRIFQKSGATYAVGVNGVNVPKRWDGSAGAIGSVGGTPAIAKTMMVLANRLLLFNLAATAGYAGVTSPSAYDVSAFNDFESGWTVAGSSTLNGLLIDTPGDIVAALEMGDLHGVIYKSDAIIMAVAQGGLVPFHFEWRVFGNVGPANPRCVVSVQDGSHVFLGSDGGLYRFDGVSVVSLGEHVKRAIRVYMNSDLTKLQSRAFLVYDRTRNEVLIYTYGPGSGVIAYIVVSMGNMSVWPQLLYSTSPDITAGGAVVVPGGNSTQVATFSGATGQGYRENLDISDDTLPYTCRLSSGASDAGDPTNYKTLTEIQPLLRYWVDDGDYAQVAGTNDVLVSPFCADDGGYGTDGSAATVSVATGYQNYNSGFRATHIRHGVTILATVGTSSNTKLFEYHGATLRAFIRGAR